MWDDIQADASLLGSLLPL